MYTEEQYQAAKEAVAKPEIPEDFKAKWRERIAEYEAAQLKDAAAAASAASAAPPAPPPPVTNDAANAVSAYEEQHPPEPPMLGAHLSDPAPSIATHGSLARPPDYDSTRPNASRLKRFTDKTEHVSSRPLASLASSMLSHPLSGASKSLYFEPTEEQFVDAMGMYLATKNIRPGTDEYNRAYDRYKDVQWEKAYQQAVADDRTLTRTEFVKRDKGWDKLGDALAQSSDVGTAFAQGYANAMAPGGPELVTAARDKLTGQDEVSEDRARLNRDPAAHFVGTVLGAGNKWGLANRVASAVGKMAPRAASAATRYGVSALAGGAAAGVDFAGNAIGQGIADSLHGRPLDEDAKSHFTARLLGTSLLGSGAGVFGEAVASGANSLRRHFRSPTSKLYPELPNLETSGSSTDILHGVRPSPKVNDIIERARAPVPGENKPMLMGSLMGEASKGLPEPLVAQQNKEYDALLDSLRLDKERRVLADPKLKEAKGSKLLIEELRRAVFKRSKPVEAEKFLPSRADELGANKNDPFIDIALKSIKPRIVPAVDAAQEAARSGGYVATLDEARGLGFPIKNWQDDIDIPEAQSLSGKTRPDATRPDVDATRPMIDEPAGSGSYANVSDSEILPDRTRPTFDTLTKQRVIESGRPPANSFTELHNYYDRSPDLQRVLDSAPPRANTYTELHTIPGIPESEYRVVLDAYPLDAMKTEDLIDSIDRAGKASNRKGDQDPVWIDLFRAARQDRRDNFGPEWADAIREHHLKLNAIEQRGYDAGIHERVPYKEMTGDARAKITANIRNYGVAEEPANQALADLASAAGGETRADLEALKGARSYVALKRQASPQAALTSGGGLLRVGGLLPGVGLRADAFARGVARGPVGEVIFNNAEKMPFVSQRELLPTSGFFALGRGAAGAKTGALVDSATGPTHPATGSIDPAQQAIIENYLNEP